MLTKAVLLKIFQDYSKAINLMIKDMKFIVLSVSAFFPLFASAQTVTGLIAKVGGWIDSLIPIVVGLALLYFLWGVAKFILASANSGDREEGKKHMFWGIVALFVIFSVWGLVQFITASTGISGPSSLPPPSVGS